MALPARLPTLARSVFQPLWVPNRVLWPVQRLMPALLLATLLVPTLPVPAARQLVGFVPVPAAALGWCALGALVGVVRVERLKAFLRGQAQ